MNTLTAGRRTFDAALELLARDDVMPSPADLARDAELAELHRRAALSAIARADAGQDVPADYLAWCRQLVRTVPPLRRPLGPGNP